MRKSRTTTTTTEYDCCDLCEHPLSNGEGWRSCAICHAKGCYRCLQGTPWYTPEIKERTYIDLFPQVCKSCLAADAALPHPHLTAIRRAVDQCDEVLRSEVKGWREMRGAMATTKKEGERS